MSTEPLWPKPVPIIGATGKHESGKTLFGLSICPGEQTLVYDFEGSSASYSDIGFVRRDVPRIMLEQFPKGYKPVDVFNWWRKDLLSIQPGQFRVIVVDPMTDIESGLVDWVNANPGTFGHTAGQYQKMSGIMWGDVKSLEKAILADIAARCETFYFTAHIGREFSGNEATGKYKAKGKATLNELASLYLWFAREPDRKGVKPDVPTATVIKSRLVSTKFVAGKMVNHAVLPPTLPEATPDAIRAYFANPAGGKALADAELAVEQKLSDDEKLIINLRTAEATRDAKFADLTLSGKTSEAGVPTLPEPRPEVKADMVAMFTAEIEAAATEEQKKAVGVRIREAGLTDDEKAKLKVVYAAWKPATESKS